MKAVILKALSRIALVTSLGSLGVAQAGVVSGSWDPLFGASLPDLSWSGQAEFWVPDTCSALSDGSYSITNALCASTTVNLATVKFFDLATDPAGTQTVDFKSLGLVATDVRVFNHQVVAVATNLVLDTTPSSAPAALGNLFALQFSLTSPKLVCAFCSPNGPNYENGNVVASVNGMVQTFYSDYNNGSPKLVDSQGNPVGVVLDGNGVFLGYTSPPVPEPGTWALMLCGLAAFSALRRRKR